MKDNMDYIIITLVAIVLASLITIMVITGQKENDQLRVQIESKCRQTLALERTAHDSLIVVGIHTECAEFVLPSLEGHNIH